MPRVLVLVVLIAVAATIAQTRLAPLAGDEDVAAAQFAGVADGPAYSPAPSATGSVSRARRRFIARADATCARSSDRGRAAQTAYARRVAGRPDARELVTRFSVRRHRGLYRALRRLGDPPEARLAYRRWLQSLDARVRLEASYAPLMRAGRAAEAQTAAQQVSALRARGEVLGRRFGLRLCA
jgi:hypothetical protein